MGVGGGCGTLLICEPPRRGCPFKTTPIRVVYHSSIYIVVVFVVVILAHDHDLARGWSQARQAQTFWKDDVNRKPITWEKSRHSLRIPARKKQNKTCQRRLLHIGGCSIVSYVCIIQAKHLCSAWKCACCIYCVCCVCFLWACEKNAAGRYKQT